MLLLNFSHPLSAEHLAQIEALTGERVERTIELPTQFDLQQPFVPQVTTLADAVGLTPSEWQTLPLLINPPALNAITAILLAELHGRMGYFPAVVRLRPVAGSVSQRFEVAEIVSLQAVRDSARQRRLGG